MSDIQEPSLAEVAAAYDRRFLEGDLRETDSFYRWVLGHLRPHRIGTLLDMSCGEGHLLRWAHELFGLNVWGIDLSEIALARARAVAPSARLLCCDGINLPFGNSTFDYITNLGGLEHYSNIPQGVQEMVRVAKPDAKLAILLPNSYYLADIVWQVMRTGYGPSHRQLVERFATVGEWRDILVAGGVEVQKIHTYNFCFPRTREDLNWYRQRPRKLLNLIIAPFVPANLAYCFLFIGRKRPKVL